MPAKRQLVRCLNQRAPSQAAEMTSTNRTMKSWASFYFKATIKTKGLSYLNPLQLPRKSRSRSPKPISKAFNQMPEGLALSQSL